MSRSARHSRRTRRGISPRTLVVALLAIVALGAIVVGITMRSQHGGPGVTLVGPPAETTATVTFAGAFPAEGDTPLRKPLGIAAVGDRLYVAEASAGSIGVYRFDGGLVAQLVLPLAPAAAASYPADIAVIDEERIVVVDNAAPRVVVLSTDPDADTRILMTLDTAVLRQPTAVAYADDEIYVADGESHTVRVFSATDGALIREVGDSIQPALSFVGGMHVSAAGSLFVSDSNNARVVVLDAVSGAQQAVFPQVLGLPKSIASGPGASLLVVDTFRSEVLLTDPSGVIIDRVSAVGEGYRLIEPRGVVWIEDDRRAYVTDASTGRVMVFNIRTEGR